MATVNTDYLRFSAYSIKDYITRKLSQNSAFTDQIYEGSNLAILIDIVSYMYQCLAYNLNNAAAEAMFSDTRLYENMNRLCKFIGYNPRGCSPSTMEFTIDNSDHSYSGIIPKYATINTGLFDDNGVKIQFSTTTDIQIDNTKDTQSVLFYNGVWKLYKTIYTGSGQQYQTLILSDLISDSTKNKYIPSEMIDVYVDSGAGLEPWKAVQQGIFTDNTVSNGSFIYNQNDCIYNVRLNEYKQYELTFGNGYNGKIPPIGSNIYIFYLESNGPTFSVAAKQLTKLHIKHSPSSFGITDSMYQQLFNISSDNSDLADILLADWTNTTASSIAEVEESVDDIRHNAPEWFKYGNRLVTANDWEYFIKNSFPDEIIDVKCQNNWEYISTLYRWLYNLGISQHNNPTYYLNSGKLSKYDFKYADAADSNNIYLWIKMRNQSDIYADVINEKVQDIKTITEEPIYLVPLIKVFSFCAQDIDDARQYFSMNVKKFDPDYQSYLEVTVDSNSAYTGSDILAQVKNIIIDFFDESNLELGQKLDYNELSKKIFGIGSITRLRTVFNDSDTGKEIIIPGISFASWTTDYIDLGDDLTISNTSLALEPFQFPTLYDEDNIGNRIKVIKKSISRVNTVQY